jgi:hypothetical protein
VQAHACRGRPYPQRGGHVGHAELVERDELEYRALTIGEPD